MRALAWLLLCAAVIQLGQGHSTPIEDGASEVNNTSYANNEFLSIDHSQMRRSRRSADCDLAECQKAFDHAEKDRERLKNETKTAEDNYESAKKAREANDGLVETEKGKLEALQDDKKKNESALTIAEDNCKQTKADFVAAEEAYKTALTEWEKLDNEAKDLLKTINDPPEELKKKKEDAEGAYNTAKTPYDTRSGKLTAWQAAKGTFDKAKAKKDQYDQDIANFKALDPVKRQKVENEGKVAQLEQDRTNAENAKKAKEQLNNAIKTNKILTKELEDDPTAIQATFGKPLKEAITEWEERGKDGSTHANIPKAKEIVKCLKEILELEGDESIRTVDELIADFDNLKNKAQIDLTAAEGDYTTKNAAVEANNQAISDAIIKLGVNDKIYNDAETKKKTADENLSAEKTKMNDNEKTMKKIAKELNTDQTEKYNEAKWKNEVKALKDTMDREEIPWTNAKTNLETAETAYNNKVTEANKYKRETLDPAETKKNTEKGKNDAAVGIKEGIDTKLNGIKSDIDLKNAELQRLEELKKGFEKQEEAANTAWDLKKGEERDALLAVEQARKDLKGAEDKKAEAIKQEQEHKDKVFALSIGLGVTGGIILIGVASGVVGFLVHRRRRKAKTPKEPKREELPADNGLTIIRREGLPDKYVVKGCDFNIRGPLVRGKVHNDLPTKHLLDDQVGGDKIEKIYFDKALNDAYFIGEGVEIMEEDSVSVSEGKKGPDPVELFAAMEADEMAGGSQRFRKEDDPKAENKTSSKSKRAKEATGKSAQPIAAIDGECLDPLLGQCEQNGFGAIPHSSLHFAHYLASLAG